MLKKYMDKKMTRGRAIRAKCMDCTCEQPAEITNCTIKICPLWPYRMGKTPAPELLKEVQNIIKEHWSKN